MLAPYPPDRLHNQHPPPPASRQSGQPIKPEIGGSILHAETQRSRRPPLRRPRGLPEAAFQRCYVHFLRNALDHLPRKADDDCLQELRWRACPWAGRRPDPRDRRSIEEARQDLAAWIVKWAARYPKLVAWVEETIEETLAFYRLPRQHHKHLKSTNMLERLNEEIRRRTRVVRICFRWAKSISIFFRSRHETA